MSKEKAKSTQTDKENKPKSTKIEMESRVNKVFDLLIAGATRAQILQYASDKGKWDVTERQVDTYIAEATKRLLEVGKTHRDYEFSRSLARLNQLYFHGFTLQNHNVCLGVVKAINQMMGIGVVKTEITTTNGQPIQMDATQIAAELLRLKALEEEKKENNE